MSFTNLITFQSQAWISWPQTDLYLFKIPHLKTKYAKIFSTLFPHPHILRPTSEGPLLILLKAPITTDFDMGFHSFKDDYFAQWTKPAFSFFFILKLLTISLDISTAPYTGQICSSNPPAVLPLELSFLFQWEILKLEHIVLPIITTQLFTEEKYSTSPASSAPIFILSCAEGRAKIS